MFCEQLPFHPKALLICLVSRTKQSTNSCHCPPKCTWTVCPNVRAAIADGKESALCEDESEINVTINKVVKCEEVGRALKNMTMWEDQKLIHESMNMGKHLPQGPWNSPIHKWKNYDIGCPWDGLLGSDFGWWCQWLEPIEPWKGRDASSDEEGRT